MTVRGHGGRVGGSPYWVQVWAVGFLPEHAWRLLNCMSLSITGFICELPAVNLHLCASFHGHPHSCPSVALAMSLLKIGLCL